jgi:hypothetical protein
MFTSSRSMRRVVVTNEGRRRDKRRELVLRRVAAKLFHRVSLGAFDRWRHHIVEKRWLCNTAVKVVKKMINATASRGA